MPPLDIFYSPTHKVAVKRRRKKRDTIAVTTTENEPMDIVWKDTPIKPPYNLTKFSQFTGAYAIATIDKEIEV